jgi:hypothetical protein
MIRVDPRDPLEIFFLTQNTRKSRKPCGIEMLLYEGIRGGARYACATIRMASTNKVCALPRILRIPREIFLSDGNIFFWTRISRITRFFAHNIKPMRIAFQFCNSHAKVQRNAKFFWTRTEGRANLSHRLHSSSMYIGIISLAQKERLFSRASANAGAHPSGCDNRAPT